MADNKSNNPLQQSEEPPKKPPPPPPPPDDDPGYTVLSEMQQHLKRKSEKPSKPDK